jgi:hypothetical protein
MTSGRGGSAAKISSVFLRAASGPLQYAASCVTSNKIQKGLEELEPTALSEAYERGVTEVARLVGVPKTEVDRILPGAERGAVLERLRYSHAAALGAWRAFSGQFGFFDVITALTVDGRHPGMHECLERVARKIQADKELARPLEALAVDVAAWDDLVVRSRHILEDREWLAAAYRRRRIMRVVLFTIPMLSLVLFTGSVVYVRIRRDSIDALIATDDPCAAETWDASATKMASSEQEEAIAELERECAARRERARAVEEEQQRKAAAERQAKEAREARERACLTLADEVERGALSDASRAVADDQAALVERIASRSLEPSDIGPADPSLPCGDTPAAHARIGAAMSSGLLADVSLWTQRAEPGPAVRRMLVDQRDRIPQNALLGLAETAERTAKAGLTGGDPDTIARAKRMCALARELGVPGRGSCTGVETL